jgi:hypothetical protein
MTNGEIVRASEQLFHTLFHISVKGAGIAVGITTPTAWTAEGSEFEFHIGRISLFSMSSRPVLGPKQPAIQWVPWALSPGIKRPRREDDHSLPSNAEIKNTWNYIPTPPYVSMA